MCNSKRVKMDSVSVMLFNVPYYNFHKRFQKYCCILCENQFQSLNDINQHKFNLLLVLSAHDITQYKFFVCQFFSSIKIFT